MTAKWDHISTTAITSSTSWKQNYSDECTSHLILHQHFESSQHFCNQLGLHNVQQQWKDSEDCLCTCGGNTSLSAALITRTWTRSIWLFCTSLAEDEGKQAECLLSCGELCEWWRINHFVLNSARSNHRQTLSKQVVHTNNNLKLFLVPASAPSICPRSAMVRAFAHVAMGRRIDPSWWTHWTISHSSQCSTMGVTKVMLYLWDGVYKRTLAVNWKE